MFRGCRSSSSPACLQNLQSSSAVVNSRSVCLCVLTLILELSLWRRTPPQHTSQRLRTIWRQLILASLWKDCQWLTVAVWCALLNHTVTVGTVAIVSLRNASSSSSWAPLEREHDYKQWLCIMILRIYILDSYLSVSNRW